MSPDQSVSLTGVQQASLPDGAAQPFRRCMVLAGGGFRFGYYLGMMAACEKYQRKPDVILASCGAAIAAAIIQRLPDDAARRAWLAGPEMYEFWQDLRPNPDKTLTAALGGVAKRALYGAAVKRIPDLFNDYLFALPDPIRLPAAETAAGNAPALAIIAGRLLYSEDDVGELRHGRALFAETVFANQRVAALLADAVSPVANDRIQASTVAPGISVVSDVSLEDAVRASISDMVYFRCHQIGEDHYLGGVLDLFPIELAHRLAPEVIMERKGFYSRFLDLPAVRTVLGFHGNKRLRTVLRQRADLWIDTVDMQIALVNKQILPQLDWRKNQLGLRMPDSYQDYRDMLQLQWEYGYRKAILALRQQRSGF